MNPEQLSERAQLLLKLLIQRYIEDGQPVGSKVLAESQRIAVSSATIRNVLAELEERGYLSSPHTSAGRIPTNKGYHFFVNSLLSVKSLDDSLLQQLKTEISPDLDNKQLMQSTSQLLSRLTHLAGVVSLPKIQKMLLRHVEFLPLSGKRVLVILVLNEKEVQNRIIHTEKTYTASELTQVSNFLTTHFCGRDLLDIRTELLTALREDRKNLDSLMQNTIEMAEQAFQTEDQEDCVIQGQDNLINYVNNNDITNLRSLFDAFTQKQHILGILDGCLAAEGVQIYIGEESGYDVFEGCSLVTAPYKVDGQIVGALGVIGPTRMAYEEVIPIVDISAKILSSALN